MVIRLMGFLFALVAGFVAVAGVLENSTVLTIGTDGPDAYADGTTVVDGECYALVWRAPGRAFAGFRADGSVVEPDYARALCVAPLAKGGRCQETTFVIDRALLASCGNGGTFGLYLLDSRKWGANGAVTVGGANGIHGSVLLSETTSVKGFLVGSGRTASTFLASALPEGVGQPTITGIRVESDDVVLTVAGTSAALNYNVAVGSSVAVEDTAAAESPVAGDAQPIELRVPRAQLGDKAFFKIVRNPLEVTK